uniref:Uncharacterized protein n=1 Tax=Steinernema glaseri TaxID=37863 RepID=A0A1I7Z7E5_9BILA
MAVHFYNVFIRHLRTFRAQQGPNSARSTIAFPIVRNSLRIIPSTTSLSVTSSPAPSISGALISAVEMWNMATQ